MSDPGSTRPPPAGRGPAEAGLRAEAARRLREAAAAAEDRDPRAFERLAWSALDLLERARRQSGADRRRAPTTTATTEEESPLSRKLTAEFLGTLWLVLGGCGSAVLAAKFPEVGIGLVGVSLAFGLTVLTMAFAIGHVSGCHLNPAVTLGLAAAGRFSGKEVPGYVVAQVLGACAGAAILWVIASGAAGFSPAGGFAANGYGALSPGKYNLASGVVTEVVMTFFFLLIILGATSDRAPKGFAPIAIGLGLTLIHLISIPVTNTSVNPARSTSQALFAGWDYIAQLWMFWAAPIAGAVAAGLLHAWLGAEDSAADRDAAAGRAALELGEPLAPATAREPR
jgi:aquaporin Z